MSPQQLTRFTDQELINRLTLESNDPLVDRLLRIIGDQLLWADVYPGKIPSDMEYDIEELEYQIDSLTTDVEQLTRELNELKARKVSDLVAELERTVEYKDSFIQGQSSQNRVLKDQLRDTREQLDSWAILNRV